MKRHAAWFAIFGLAAALGCAGKRLNDVGDLNTGGAGEGGAGDGSGGTVNKGGATTGGSGGANGGGRAGGAAGTNGGGTAGGSGGTAGGGSVGREIGPCDEGDGCVFGEGTGIRALAADATRLYWVEYGTSDELGNYNNDGRLLARAFESSEVTTLATDLAGATGIFVTSTHAYAIVDRVWQDGGERYAIVRAPLEGGEAHTVYVDLTPRTYGKCAYDGKCFYTYDDAGYWVRTDGVWEITSASDEAVRIANDPLEMSLDLFGIDESHLYYINGDYGPSDPIELWKIPRTGGDAELVTNDAKNGRHVLSGEYIYALQGTLLRMPKAGGRWTALAQLFASAGYYFVISDEKFLFDSEPGDSIVWSLTLGSLSSPEATAVIVHLPVPPDSWVATPHGVYWTDGATIYLRAID